MSNAVNFNNMPVNYGLLYAFDCNTYVDGDVWTDFYGKSNFALTNAVKAADGAIDFTVNSGNGILSVGESYNDSTEYYILKTNGTDTRTTYYFYLVTKDLSDTTRHALCYVGGESASTRYFGAFEKTNGSNNNFVTSTISAATDYHVVAVNRVGNTHRIFIDGVLAITQNGMTVFAPAKYKIWDLTIIRCAVICNSTHSEGEILQNSNWLLEQYGLKPRSKNSRLAGTDAVAIAYAIARNQESTAALQQLKKAYQDGMLDGDGKTTPTYETDDPEPTIKTDPENDDTHGQTGDGTVIDVSKGVWLTYNDDSGNPSAYVRVYTDNYFWDRSLSGSYDWRKRRICVDIYSADGTQLYSDYDIFWINTGRTCEYMSHGDKSESSLSGHWYYSISIKIRNNCVVPIIRKIIKDDKGVTTTDEISERAASYSFSYLAGVSLGTYSKCTNVSPI